MRVKATQYLDVHLSDSEIDEVFHAKFFNMTSWKDDYFIDNGMVKVVEGRHPRDYEETIRNATELDYVCEKLFVLIEEQKK